MSSSAVSGGVGDEAAGGAVELVVERDASGEGEQALADAFAARISTADFDPLRYVSSTHDRTTAAVELLI